MRKKTLFFKLMKFCMALCLICAVLFGVFAAGAANGEPAETATAPVSGASWNEKLCDPNGGVLSVAYRGETVFHEANTLDAVAAAADAGADLVSVEVTKSADGRFVLTGAQNAAELSEVCAILSGRAGLIADFEKEDLPALCRYLRENGLCSLVLPRAALPAKQIVAFTKENPDIWLLGVYRGNVVMNANAFLQKLSKAGLPLVQYQNKNYFCVSFQKFTTKRFSSGGNGRAMVNMTRPELCGRRDDSVTGWDDMICRGFSVVETGNIEGLCAYLRQREAAEAPLRQTLETAKRQPLDALSNQSAKTLAAAIAAGEAATRTNAALSERQSALSALQNALSSAIPAGENETQQGALQITTGKTLTVLFFAVLVFAVQVYMHKKRNTKEQKGE